MNKCPVESIDCDLPLNQMNGMRNVIIHTYSKIDNSILYSTIKDDLPAIKEYIENNVHEEILNYPSILFDQEYEDFIRKNSNSMEM